MSDNLRVGVVGAGWWAVVNHMPILKSRSDVELVAVSRLGSTELAKVQATFGVPYASEDFATMLNEAPMDALVIASPHNLHGAHAIAALEKGIHVLVEKPMTVSAVEARAIASLASAKGLHVLIPYGWNFKPFFAQAQRLVRAGRVGRIRHVSAQMATPVGDLMTGSDLAGTEQAMFRPDPRTWANPNTGGYGWGQLVHMLGGLFYITDLAPTDVFAFVGRSELGADLYNAAAVRFADGATASVSGSATVPAGSPFQVDIRIFGDAGMLLLDVERERLSLRRLDGDGRRCRHRGWRGGLRLRRARQPFRRSLPRQACRELRRRQRRRTFGRSGGGDVTLGEERASRADGRSVSAKAAPPCALARKRAAVSPLGGTMLTTSQIDFYRENGYLVAPDVIPQDWLARVASDARATDREVARSRDQRWDLRSRRRTRAGKSAGSPDQGSACQRRDLRRDADVVADHGPGRPIDWSGLAHGSLQAQHQAGARAASRWKWHQDWAFYPHTNDDILEVGVMIEDCTLDNGPMLMIPGSHRGPVFDHHHHGYFAGAMDPVAAGIDVAAAVPVTGKAGTISLHHVRTVHGSRANLSDRDRPLLLFGYRAADAWPLRSDWFKDLESFNAMMVRGEPTLQPRLRDVPVRMPYPPSPASGVDLREPETRQGPFVRHGDVSARIGEIERKREIAGRRVPQIVQGAAAGASMPNRWIAAATVWRGTRPWSLRAGERGDHDMTGGRPRRTSAAPGGCRFGRNRRSPAPRIWPRHKKKSVAGRP